VLDFLELILAS